MGCTDSKESPATGGNNNNNQNNNGGNDKNKNQNPLAGQNHHQRHRSIEHQPHHDGDDTTVEVSQISSPMDASLNNNNNNHQNVVKLASNNNKKNKDDDDNESPNNTNNNNNNNSTSFVLPARPRSCPSKKAKFSGGSGCPLSGFKKGDPQAQIQIPERANFAAFAAFSPLQKQNPSTNPITASTPNDDGAGAIPKIPFPGLRRNSNPLVPTSTGGENALMMLNNPFLENNRIPSSGGAAAASATPATKSNYDNNNNNNRDKPIEISEQSVTTFCGTNTAFGGASPLRNENANVGDDTIQISDVTLTVNNNNNNNRRTSTSIIMSEEEERQAAAAAYAKGAHRRISQEASMLVATATLAVAAHENEDDTTTSGLDSTSRSQKTQPSSPK